MNVLALPLAKFGIFFSSAMEALYTIIKSVAGGKGKLDKTEIKIKDFLPYPDQALEDIGKVKAKKKQKDISVNAIALFWEMRANNEFGNYIDKAFASNPILLELFKKKRPKS